MWLSFDGTLLYTNFYRRCQDSKTAQHWLASSFSSYRNENFLGGAFWGTIYPKDISYGGTKDIMYWDTKKNRDVKYPMTPETAIRLRWEGKNHCCSWLDSTTLDPSRIFNTLTPEPGMKWWKARLGMGETLRNISHTSLVEIWKGNLINYWQGLVHLG